MYQVAYGSLAAAVANAGGLGMIGSAYMPPARLREEIRTAKAQTDKPIDVDILFAKTTGGGATTEANERERRRAHSGKPNRMIRNEFTRSWEGREAAIKPYPMQLREVGEPAYHRGRIVGDVAHGVLPCGQSAALIEQIERAGDVVERIAREAASVSRLARSAE